MENPVATITGKPVTISFTSIVGKTFKGIICK